MKTINLTQGFSTMVDDLDYVYLSCFNWCVAKGTKTHYAYNRTLGKMHRLIMPVDDPLMVDHVDRNGLNNQRSNLRASTKSQNAVNQAKVKPGTSKYKGVYWKACRNKWVARIRIKGKLTVLGCFLNERDAAMTYDKFAKIHFGEYAYLNFDGGVK